MSERMELLGAGLEAFKAERATELLEAAMTSKAAAKRFRPIDRSQITDATTRR